MWKHVRSPIRHPLVREEREDKNPNNMLRRAWSTDYHTLFEFRLLGGLLQRATERDKKKGAKSIVGSDILMESSC